jgi:hypothetical protein
MMDRSIVQASLTRRRGVRVAADVDSRGAGGAADRGVVELQQVAWHGWRACDSRVRADDPHRLLGFIEERDSGVFEVMQLGRGFHWFTFSSLGEASEYLLRTARDATAERMAGELSWIS